MKGQCKTNSKSNIALELLDELILEYYKTLKEKATKNPKLGEWIKMLELRIKLAPDEKSQAEIWKKIDQVRRELLGKKTTVVKSKKSSAVSARSTKKKEKVSATK